MINQTVIAAENQQLIYYNQPLNTWKKVTIIGSSLLFGSIPGIALTYCYNQKITQVLGSDNKFSLPISMLVGGVSSSLLTLVVIGSFIHKNIFLQWYEKRAEINCINKLNAEIESLVSDFANINSLPDNMVVKLRSMLEALNTKKTVLENREKPLMCQWELTRMIDELITVISSELTKFEYISVPGINDMVDNLEEVSNDNRQTLLFY